MWGNVCFSSAAKQPFISPPLLHHTQQPTKFAKVKKRAKPRLLEWSKADITSFAGVKAHLSKQYFVRSREDQTGALTPLIFNAMAIIHTVVAQTIVGRFEFKQRRSAPATADTTSSRDLKTHLSKQHLGISYKKIIQQN